MVLTVQNCIEIVKEDEKVICQSSRLPYYPLVVKRAKGAIVEDLDGNQYIDLLSSAAAANIGHSHPKVVAAIIEQAQEFVHYTPVYMYHEPLVKLAKELVDITPGNFRKKVVFGLSGSDANDGVIKLARAYTGRSKIITYIQSYHGATYGALSMSAISTSMRNKVGPLVPDIHHIPYPDCYRCLFGKNEENCNMECFTFLENAFKYYIPIEEVAAIVIEPIAGDAGIIVPPKRYMDRLYSLCKEHEILFVSEEVQQGFGRTGKWFGIEHFNIQPDMIVMGKSIASGLPLSAIVAREEIIESLGTPGHLFTTGGNPIACRAALATIEVIREENLIDRGKELGAYTKERFIKMKDKYPLIGDVRGLGLSIGVDLVKDRLTKVKDRNAAAKVCYRCWEKGVLVTFFSNNVLRIQPPLVISREQIDKALDIIEESIMEYIEGSIPDEVLEVAKGW